jgi:hypothetical protein
MRVIVFLDYSFIIPKLNLNFALDNYISANSGTQSETTSGFKKFEVIESNTNSKPDNKKAYELIFQTQRKGDTFKYFTIGTIINDNQVLGINFKAPLEEFDMLLPTFQHMIDSFKIRDVVNNNDTNISEADESRSVTNINNNQDTLKKIFEKDEND